MSLKLAKILGPDGSTIYIQYDEGESDELRAAGFIEDIAERTEKIKEMMVSTIRGYSSIVLNAVREGMADITAPESVTLEFGLQIGGEMGVPLITKGTAQANVKVTVTWDLNK
jgi:hypothetical protein